MTESFKYLWLLLKEEPVYGPIVILIICIGLIFAFSIQPGFKSMRGKVIFLTVVLSISMVVCVGAIEPETTYKQIQQRKNDVAFILKKCKVSAFEAQQAGLLGTTKDAWSCPDGITRYLPVKYRTAGATEADAE